MRWGVLTAGVVLAGVLFATNPATDQFLSYLSPKMRQAAHDAALQDPSTTALPLFSILGGSSAGPVGSAVGGMIDSASAENARQQAEAATLAGLRQYVTDHLTRHNFLIGSVYVVCIPGKEAGHPGSLRPWLGIGGQFFKLGHREC